MLRLLDEIDVLHVSGDPALVEITSVEHDSRRTQPGCLLYTSAPEGHLWRLRHLSDVDPLWAPYLASAS